MTEPGDKIHAALKRHQASVQAARDTADSLAAEREASVTAAVAVRDARTESAAAVPLSTDRAA